MRPRTGSRLMGQARGAYHWLCQNVDLFMLIALAMIAITGWLVAELADEVLEGTTQHYDEWILCRLRTPGDTTDPIGPEWFEDVWRDITALGSITVLALVTMACAGYLLMRRRYRMLGLLGAATVGGLLASLLLKNLFARPRPEFASAATHVVTSSFPSGHSMLSAVVYLTLGALLARTSTRLRYKLYFVTVALLITILVGLSRIYLGVHYPTDVLAGWSFGLIWALLCWLVARFLQRRGAIEQPSENV
ncbi:MAG: phosphatase PAP2 family protein [Planctomycetes bacterium]|nr:phosphatase PAP2 family protein [Planctomycetota bacterium]